MCKSTWNQYILLLLFVWFSFPNLSVGQERYTIKTEHIDSIMKYVYSYTTSHDLVVKEASAKVFTNFEITTFRKNGLTRWIPGLFKFDRGKQHYVGNEHLDLRIHPNGIIDARRVAFSSNSSKIENFSGKIKNRYTLNIYQTNLFGDRLLSPLNVRNRFFYKYIYKYAFTEDGEVLAHIEIRKRFENTQLVSGYVNVSLSNGAVRSFMFDFYYDMVHFEVTGQMGKDGLRSLYPRQLTVAVYMNFLGNRLRGIFQSFIYYHFYSDKNRAKNQRKYDQTTYYKLRINNSCVIHDSSYFQRREDSIPHVHFIPSQMMDTTGIFKSTKKNFLGRIDDFFNQPIGKKGQELDDILFDKHYIRLKNTQSYFLLPPLLAPEMFQWTHRKGIFLQTKTRLNIDFNHRLHADLNLKLGYSFKQHLWEWLMPVQLKFNDLWQNSFTFLLGGGNVVYNNQQVKEQEKLLPENNRINDNAYTFYRDNYYATNYSFSPSKGLWLGVELKYDVRIMLKHRDFFKLTGNPGVVKSLSPKFHFEWTPKLFYYMKDETYVPLYSYWPTFRFDYSRGLRVGHADNRYEMLELDVQYNKPLYALRALYFRLGWGQYTFRKGRYFLAYNYFNDVNILQNWGDNMSGKFFLLPSQWYNNSPYYVRLGVTYETPMFLLSRMKYFTSIIQKERLYFNVVQLKNLSCYTEIGYGISTHIADVSGFVALSKKVPKTFGIRLVFRWFNEW